MPLNQSYLHHRNYGVILGEESMRALDIDTSVRNNTISWSDKEITMVPRKESNVTRRDSANSRQSAPMPTTHPAKYQPENPMQPRLYKPPPIKRQTSKRWCTNARISTSNKKANSSPCCTTTNSSSLAAEANGKATPFQSRS
jgi:hypothetical protein